MRLSFRARLQIALIGTVVLASLAGFWAVATRIDAAAARDERLVAAAQLAAVQALVDERAATLRAESAAVALYPAVSAAVQAGNTAPLATWAHAVAAQQSTHVTVVDAQGLVVTRSHDPAHTGDDLAAVLPGLRQALAGQQVSGVEDGDELGLALRGYAPVLQQGQLVGVVMLADPLDAALLARLAAGGPTPRIEPGSAAAGCITPHGQPATCRAVLHTPTGAPAAALAITVPLAAIRQTRSDALRGLLLLGLPLALLGVIAAWLLGRSLSRPLARLSTSAATIGSSEPGSVVPIEGPPEVAALAAALERLRLRVQTAQQALRRDRDVLQAVLDATEDGIVLLDRTGERIAGNARWEVLTSGQNAPTTMLRQTGTARTLDDLRAALIATDETVATLTLERATPPQHLRLFSAPTPIPGAAATGRVLVLHDATRETEVERMRSALIATVSHELRSPLTAIKGYGESLLSAGPWDAATEREFLQVIIESADRLAELVDNLLDAARLESGTLALAREPVQLGPLVRRLVESRRPLAPQHQFDLDIDEPLPLVNGDPRRLTQVVANLLDNAVKYTPQGGPIRVALRGGDRVTIAVTDRGIGIPPDALPHLFARFYRAENAAVAGMRGTGLGLFICRSLVEAHGGAVHVSSTLGAGSVFTVELPACSNLEPATECVNVPV